MPHNNNAFELIKKFQQLFTDLNHRQIAERLVNMVVIKPAVSRVVLVLERDKQLVVETIAYQTTTEPRINTITTLLSRLKTLPQNAIEQAFKTGLIEHYDQAAINLLPEGQTLDGTVSAMLVPIVEKDLAIAAFYIESKQPLENLERTVIELEAVWLFSALLVRKVIELSIQEEQADHFRVAKQALWASETYLRAILRHSPALISVKDLNGNIVLASHLLEEIASVDEAGIIGKSIFEIYPQHIAQSIWQLNNSEPEINAETEVELTHKDGTVHTYLAVKFPLRDKDGNVFGICTIATEITERKRAEDALREQQTRLNYMAFHDALTTLPNRSLFYDRIFHGLARARRANSKVALMLLDIDRFKIINDSLGHDAGDLLLKAIATRLSEGVRDMDTVARLGGDEFVVVLEAVHDLNDVVFVANKLLVTLARPIEIAGHQITTTVSIGVSIFPDDGADTDELLKNADIAMYKAKEAGKNNCQFYARGMNASAVNYLLLESDLRRAVELQQFTLHYQPQINLKTGELMGVEALVRWNHPERGLVSPLHFIPLAEETGLIVPIGDWVMRQACQQIKRWHLAGLTVGRIAVNLSPRQFRQKNFAGKVADLLQETALSADFLELEITESRAMENASETINQLRQLHAMGLYLAIDDFGTGYSSLAYLQRFPIQKLKIDSSFVRDIRSGKDDAAIVRTIINLAHSMQVSVVAEGIETEYQANWLRAQGCDQGQGYLFAKPLSVEVFEQHFIDGKFIFNEHRVALEQASH